MRPEVWPALETLVDPVTRGDPESPLRWTCKSTHALSPRIAADAGFVSVGVDHDTPVFAVTSIEAWWKR